MPSKKRRGPHSIKSKKKNQRVRIEANDLNHLPKPTNLSTDPKRRIGHHSGTATPPLMKK